MLLTARALRLPVSTLTAAILASAALRASPTDSQAPKVPAGYRTVTIDHRTGIIAPAGTIGLFKDEDLRILLEGTYPSCYTYNFEAIQPAPPPLKKKRRGTLRSETVTFIIRHDGKAAGYRIRATKRPAAGSECTLESGVWEIPVETYEWSISLTGAFTLDRLRDPVFSLEPATVAGAPGNPDTQGFRVREDRGARDHVVLGIGSMIHLFHSSPTFLSVGREISWAPVTFGIAVAGKDSKAKYFLGTSIKAGGKFYLTLGYAFGPVHRLPDGVKRDAFVENANILGSLPSRTVGRPFLSLSYSFIEVSPSRFNNLFAEPKPQSGATAPAPETAAPEPKIAFTIDRAKGKVDDPITITLSGGAVFTGDPEKDLIEIGDLPVVPKPAVKKGESKATVRIPQLPKGNASVVVVIDGVESDPLTFEVTDKA